MHNNTAKKLPIILSLWTLIISMPDAYLVVQVEKTNDCIGDEVAQKVSAMQNGEVILLHDCWHCICLRHCV